MEEWRDVPGYEGLYQVSNLGRVRSEKRSTTRGVILKGKINTHGYVEVTLSKKNVRKTARVHRMVAIAFIPNPEGKPQVNHRNGDRSDNRAENLEWCTASENMVHARDVLHHLGGKRKYIPIKPRRRFTDDEIRQIRSSNKSSQRIAQETGVSKQAILAIRHRKSYREVI